MAEKKGTRNSVLEKRLSYIPLSKSVFHNIFTRGKFIKCNSSISKKLSMQLLRHTEDMTNLQSTQTDNLRSHGVIP